MFSEGAEGRVEEEASAEQGTPSAVEQPGPLLSVLMPVYNPPEPYLREAIESVIGQTFADWELVVVDDGSSADHVGSVLARASEADRRITVLRNDVNAGIVATTNTALAASRGEFVAFMDHDDVLDPEALERCAEALASADDVDLVYTDEDRLDLDGGYVSTFLKPDWSPERLRSQMYVGHLSVMRRELVAGLGGFRAGFDGSQDYDLALRVSEQARRILHVPEVLYHWRLTPGSVSMEAHPVVFDAARRAIEEHTERIGMPSWVEQVRPEGVYRVHRQVRGEPLVSLIIPTRGSRGSVHGEDRIFILSAVRSVLETSTYKNLEFVVIADRSMDVEIAEQLEDLLGQQLTLLWYDRPFNYSHKTNLGVAAARGEYLLLLNDDIEVISPDWIEVFLGLAQQDDVGLVGAMLYFEDGTIQHAGHVYYDQGLGHVALRAFRGQPGPASGLFVEREVYGVTGACAMISYRDYVTVGGLCQKLPVNFNDVDLSLKVRQAGLRIVWTPHAELFHYESKSRVPVVLASELEIITRRWGRMLDEDPYWRYHGTKWFQRPELVAR
jgi:O-antigen biosynthesis protein